MDVRSEILTAADVAEMLRISRSQVYKMLHSGELRSSAIKLFDSSRGWRWRRRDIEALIDGHTIGNNTHNGPRKRYSQKAAPLFSPEMINLTTEGA